MQERRGRHSAAPPQVWERVGVDRASTMPPARDGEPRLPHLPALDGLRAIAVTAVLLFHGGVRWAGGGFLGVDVFFALSGFLITSLLLHEAAATGGVRLRAFWARRARRLLPALVVVVIAVCVYGRALATSDVRQRLGGDALAALMYVANWHLAFTGNGYFDRTALPSPLQHTWSLGIEEQFYVVWPLVVLLVAAAWAARRTTLAAFSILGAVGSILWMLLLRNDGASVNRLYYGTDTRAVALLCGAALAAAALPVTVRGGRPDEPLPWWRAWSRTTVAFAALSILLVLAVVARADSTWLYPWGFLGVALATTTVIGAVLAHPTGPVAELLATKPLVAVGRVSYGVYLWHWPVYQALDGERTGLAGGALLWLRLAVTAGVSVLSYYVVEQPMRRSGGAGRHRVQLTAATAALATAAALVLVLSQAAVPRLPGQSTPVAHADVVDPPAPVVEPSTPQAAAVAPTAATPSPSALPGVPGRMLVVGDSVAMSLASGVAPYFKEHHHDVVDGGRLGCGIAEGSPFRYFGNEQEVPAACADWASRWQRLVRAYHPQLALVLVGRWEIMDRKHDGQWMHVGEPVYDAYLGGQLDKAFDTLSATGVRVATVTAPYFKRGERPDGGLWPEDETWRVDRWNEILREAVARHPGVLLADLHTKMAPDGIYENHVAGVMLREDGVHLTSDAGWWLAPWLLEQLGF